MFVSCENDVLFYILVHASNGEWNRKRHAHTHVYVWKEAKKRGKRNRFQCNWSYLQTLNEILTVSHYAMYLLVWCVCVRWIFNICHCIHAFALIVLQSTASILRMHRVHSYRIDASCTIAYWVERENTCDAFFFIQPHSVSISVSSIMIISILISMPSAFFRLNVPCIHAFIVCSIW